MLTISQFLKKGVKKVYKELSTPNSKKMNNPVRKWAKAWIDTPPRMSHMGFLTNEAEVEKFWKICALLIWVATFCFPPYECSFLENVYNVCKYEIHLDMRKTKFTWLVCGTTRKKKTDTLLTLLSYYIILSLFL